MKVERESLAIVPEQIPKLKELFTEAVSEGKVDFDFVCRDVALDDETAANRAPQCRLRTI